MKIKNSPELFISVSSSPGKFGETVHNSAFRFHKLNYVYKAIRAVNIRQVVKSLRELDIRGCSVSMPFKEKIIPCLDKVDSLAKRAGAVNTVLNKNNKLIGYNTDVYGATQALKSINIRSRDDILILGAGEYQEPSLQHLKKIIIVRLLYLIEISENVKNLQIYLNVISLNGIKEMNLKLLFLLMLLQLE